MAVLDFPGDMVPLDKEQQGRLRRDLHPAQLLLVCLNDICPRGPPPKPPSDSSPNPNQSPEESFHTFVNKLAQILDFEPKGNTITALTVILLDAKVTYVFASNQRGPGALNNARKCLKEVLDILKSNIEATSKAPDHVIEKRLMDKILWWNKVRVRSYLTALSKELQTCMGRCDNTQEGTKAKQALADLASTLPDLNQGGQKTEIYIEATVQCIKAIQANRNSPLQRYISARSAEDHNMGKGGSWSNLQHAAGRLLSYQYAVEVLVHAHHMWADTDLFRDFEIESIRSSKPYPADANLLNPTPETAELILNRAPGTEVHKQELKQSAVELEKYHLKKHFQSRWEAQAQAEKGMRRIVHAEILLHSWLLATEGGVRSHRFFQGWQYIGTSKPPCRMCTEYFTTVISTPVQFRAPHPNSYLNFRLPDPYVDGKQKGKEQREKQARQKWCEDLGKMKAGVYAAVARVLREKVAEWKRFDSNTYTDRVRSVRGDGGDVALLTSWLGR
ncbi:hypothetical protein B0T16DRAFT_434405 [Cercophora newfieldiana]|uniref:Uncharacterized protein n=1 Tax=Cercophora newfieldiana TaxID=92897 RepID=A0AA39YEC2_9PEZI|nr:hypothetical protein B0T16DRAFT_434405 [Cercophora newfieldiana]